MRSWRYRDRSLFNLNAFSLKDYNKISTNWCGRENGKEKNNSIRNSSSE
jgi:hypothetical protein